MPTKISPKLSAKLRRIKLFLCDVDGVLTDGSIFIGAVNPPPQSSGAAGEFKRYNIRDGLGLVLLRRAGIKIGWVSARPSHATKLRADELKIHFLVQQNDKQSKSGAVEELLAQEKLSWDEVCFVGDDIVDLGPLKKAGLSVAVADSVDEAKAAADYVTKNRGGHGAIREVVEMILKAQGKWKLFLDQYSE